MSGEAVASGRSDRAGCDSNEADSAERMLPPGVWCEQHKVYDCAERGPCKLGHSDKALAPSQTRLGPLVIVRYSDGFWFRLFGWGLTVQRPAHHDGYVPFSERNGYRRAWHVGGACIKALRPARGSR